MKAMFKKMAPLFEKGGKFEKYYPLFEAGERFMYSSAARTQGGAHVRDGIDLKRLMMTVIIALLPAIFMSLYNTGVQGLLSENVAMSDIGLVAAIARGAMVFLPIYIVTLAVGGILETVFAVVRKHEINEGFLVTSMLFPLIVPPTIPLWQVALGIAFGTVIGKEVFGGTGMNILNPALTGRLFLFFAYPGQISGDKVWLDTSVDGFTMATPLGNLQADGMSAVSDLSWMDAFIGFLPGSLGETSALACLIGALILIFTKVASWRIMLGSVFGLIGMSYLLKTFAPDAAHYMAVPWYWHLVLGGFAFGTVFMATDPVSAAQTDTGRWVYGIMIGVLTVLVRVLNPAYPEGMMMAIIFMNLFAPVIDYYVVKSNIKKREQRLGLQ